MTSLALTFVDLSRNDFELSLISLCEALQSYASQASRPGTNHFKKLIISSLDVSSLYMLKDYLENGYDRTILHQMNTSGEQEVNRQQKQSQQNQKLCIKCKSNKYVLRDFHFHDLKCDFCEILFQTSQIYFKCLSSSSDELVCFKCAIKSILNQIKKYHCTSCLREENRTFVNQLCSRHTVCSACAYSSPSPAHICYMCSFLRLYAKFSTIESESLIDDHDRLVCSHDFCDLSLNDIKLACGHTSKCEIDTVTCQYCALFKTLRHLAEKYGFELDELFQNNTEQTNNQKEEEIEKKNGFKTFSKITTSDDSLLGYENCGTILISLLIPDGIQSVIHSF